MNAASSEVTNVVSRRDVLRGGAGVAALLGATAALAAPVSGSSRALSADRSLPNSSNTLVVGDGTRIFFKDWGTGQPIVFSHGWPLTADAWDAQALFFTEQGYRVIAHDRRGHGRSSQSYGGNDMSTYADDLAALMDHLDLKDVAMVGHSAGGGEVVRYVGRHGQKRVARIVLAGAVPPWMLQSAANPVGAPMAVFDQLRGGVRSDHAQLYRDLSAPFFGTNRPGAKPWQGLRDAFWMQAMTGSHKSLYDSIKAFSETDFTGDLAKITVPTLLVHGDDDQIVPIQIASERTVKLIKGATLTVYPGAPHGLPLTHQDQFNADLLAFFRA